MAIIITTKSSQNLIDDINRAIKDHSILDWEIDSEGDYTLTEKKWKLKAWFRAVRMDDTKVIFKLIKSNEYDLTRIVYGVFHGRLITLLLSHFDLQINEIDVMPLLSDYDMA